MLEIIALNALSNEEYEQVMNKSIRTFDDVIMEFSHNIYENKKGKKTVIGTRLPSKPAQSPLLLKEENYLV